LKSICACIPNRSININLFISSRLHSINVVSENCRSQAIGLLSAGIITSAEVSQIQDESRIIRCTMLSDFDKNRLETMDDATLGELRHIEEILT